MKKIILFASLTLAIELQSYQAFNKNNELTPIDSPAAINSEEPFLTTGANGSVYLSWVEKNGDLATLFYSELVNNKWSAPKKIADGNDWFVNWADHPVLAVNKSGDMIAHYLQKSDSGTYTYDIKVVAKKSGNTEWSEPVKLHDDNINAEHGFVSMQPMSDGNFLLSWLDGRNTVSSNHNHGESEMTLRAAILTNEGKKTQEWELDQRVCDCCQTSNGIAGKTPVIVYRDRSKDEVRDMSIVRYVNNQWTQPKPVFSDNWKIAGCPVNGPSLGTINNYMAVGWFTNAEEISKVNVVFSNDSGETFGKPIRVDEGNALGRVKIKLIDANTAFVSWMEGNNILGSIVDKNGQIIRRYSLASSSEDRSSGIPQIALIDDVIVMAWTDAKSKQVKTGVLNL